MAGRSAQQNAHRQLTEALARGELSGEERRATQRHLEECESCRTLFRQRTADRFPRFRSHTILELIGEGGFGRVYKVIHHAKERTEALKVLFSKTPIRARYFQNEVHLVAKLRHPNIATLYEAHLGQPPMFYTMDFVEGRQLDEYFRAQHAPLAERIRIVKTVAGAIGYAHQQGVIHRDIKPQNILIDAAGEPHIVDFGIGKKLGLADTADRGRPPAPEGAVGTFGYIAPEQIAGEPVDERADIYALGALLHHSVTGEPARCAASAARLMQTLRERQVTRAEDLAAIIARCMHPLPEQRYPSCAALIEDLDNYLAGRQIRAHKDPTAAYQALRAAAFLLRTRPLLVRVFIVAAVATVLVFLSWLADARWFAAGAATQSTVLVTATTETWDAIAEGRIGGDLPGLDAARPKSFRLLQGRLMERLAEGQPLVVVWDGFFPDCQPQFDDRLIKGVAALRAVDVPVVVGVRYLDINSDPEDCPRILSAVHAYGILFSVTPSSRPDEWVVPVCLRRGFANPVPGLAVAGFAAARHPDAQLDLEIQPDVVVLRYRKREVVAGEPRWHEDTDRIRYVNADQVDEDGLFLAGDLVLHMHVPAAQDAVTPIPRISFDDVLSADRAQLQRWFRGRAVVIGDTRPGVDEHPTFWREESVFGCQVHARTLAALLSGMPAVPFEKPRLLTTVFLWAVLGAVLAGLIPCSRTRGLSVTAWTCSLGLAVGALVIVLGPWKVTDYWHIQATLAGATLLATGCMVYLAKAVRTRQLQLAPESSWAAGDDTIASTLLAAASSDDGGTETR